MKEQKKPRYATREELERLIEQDCFISDSISKSYLQRMLRELPDHPVKFDEDFSSYQGHHLAVCHHHGFNKEVYIYELTNPLKQDIFLEEEDGEKVPYCEQCSIQKMMNKLLFE